MSEDLRKDEPQKVEGSSAQTDGVPRSRGMGLFGRKLINFLKTEDGPTAVEYAVMLALIIVVCISAVTALGTNAQTLTAEPPPEPPLPPDATA